MKKVLMLAAASLLAFGGSAVAKTKTYTISLGGAFCVVAQVNVTGKQVAANENDNCQKFIGGGLIATVKRKAGKQAILGGTTSQIPGAILVISLDYPFVSGGNYTVYGTSDGVTLSKVGSGNYTVE
jgi:hypothetical protein